LLGPARKATGLCQNRSLWVYERRRYAHVAPIVLGGNEGGAGIQVRKQSGPGVTSLKPGRSNVINLYNLELPRPATDCRSGLTKYLCRRPSGQNTTYYRDGLMVRDPTRAASTATGRNLYHYHGGPPPSSQDTRGSRGRPRPKILRAKGWRAARGPPRRLFGCAIPQRASGGRRSGRPKVTPGEQGARSSGVGFRSGQEPVVQGWARLADAGDDHPSRICKEGDPRMG